MLRLYDNIKSANGYKIRLLLAQLKIPHQRIELDIFKGASRTPEFLAKFPNGRIPAVELDDGRLLFESDAILFYFAQGTPMLPDDPFQRAEVLQWMFFEQYSHEPYIAVMRYLLHVDPSVEDLRRAQKDRLTKLGYDALGVMEHHLANREWFVGANYSIADIALYAYTHVAEEGGFDLTPYHNVRKWLARVKTQPGHMLITDG